MEKLQTDDDLPMADEANQPHGEGKRKEDLQDSLNERISYLCRLAAFVIAVVTFATTVLGQSVESFVVMGLSLSVALLAIAGLQNHRKSKH